MAGPPPKPAVVPARAPEQPRNESDIRYAAAPSAYEKNVTLAAATGEGALTLAEYVHKGRERDLHVSCGRRILGDLGQFTPR